MRLAKTICALLSSVMLVNCGGGNGENNNQVEPSLSGTWFFVSPSAAGPLEYQGEHIIKQTGNAVEITHCDRNTISLVKEDNLLYFNGAPFYLTVVDSKTLSGLGDTGSVSVVEKLSERTVFQDGSFELASPQISDFTHDSNVCADLRKGRFACGGPELYPDRLTITTEYKASFVKLAIAFKEINVATYDVVDFCTFVDGDANQVYVELESPEFESFIGPNRYLSIETGSIHVTSVDERNFTVSGTLASNEGYEFSFVGAVDLTKPDYP